jgi:hypothetical protein
MTWRYRYISTATEGIIGSEFEYGAVVFFDLQANLKLALYPRKSLSKDSGLPLGTPNALEFSVGHNVSSKAEVNQVMEQAKNAGGCHHKVCPRHFLGRLRRLFSRPRWSSLGNCLEPAMAYLRVRHNNSFKPKPLCGSA